MTDIEKEIIWAQSTTGEDFQCVHVDFAREQQAEIERLRAALIKHGCHTFACAYPESHAKLPCDCGWEQIARSISNEQVATDAKKS